MTKKKQKQIEDSLEVGNDAGEQIETTETPVAPVEYLVLSGVPLPPKKERAARKPKKTEYPFNALEIGHSFFVPNSEKRPNAAKTLRTSVGQAMRRLSIPSPDETVTNRKGAVVPKLTRTKLFEVHPVAAGQRYENGFEESADGARVYRTA